MMSRTKLTNLYKAIAVLTAAVTLMFICALPAPVYAAGEESHSPSMSAESGEDPVPDKTVTIDTEVADDVASDEEYIEGDTNEESEEIDVLEEMDAGDDSEDDGEVDETEDDAAEEEEDADESAETDETNTSGAVRILCIAAGIAAAALCILLIIGKRRKNRARNSRGNHVKK